MKKTIPGLVAIAALLSVFAAAAEAQYAYVTNLNDNTVSVISVATNTVVKTISVGLIPYGIAINPAGTLAYVATYSDNGNISVINTSTYAVTKILTGGSPKAAAVSPDGGTVYLSSNNSTNILVWNVNATTNAVTIVPLGCNGSYASNPEEIAVSPDGKHVYVADNYNASVSIIDTTAIGTATCPVTNISVGLDPFGVAVTPDGTRVFISNYGTNTVSVLDTTKSPMAVIATLQVGNRPRGIAINAKGTLAYVANNLDNTVSVIDPHSNLVLGTIAVGNSPVNVAFTPDGSAAYVTNSSDNTVTVIHPADLSTSTIEVGNQPVAVAVGGPATVTITSGGIVDPASYKPSVVPGSLAAVFGTYPVSGNNQAPSTPWGTSLGGLSMQFTAGSTSVAAPFYFDNSSQANVQIPWELAGQSSASVTASYGGATSSPQQATLVTAAPVIFMKTGQQGAIVDTSGNVVDSSNPAKAGTSVVAIYCTGLGPVTNQPATGAAGSGSPLSYTTLPVTVTIGGVPTTIAGGATQAFPDFSGLAPTLVGVYQVNVLVPPGAPSGSAVPVVMSVNGVNSNTVTMGIQ